jgi:hypothetical protein
MRTLAAIALLLLAVATPAAAHFCATDQVPAATLLVPWVAVSMNGDQPDPNGYTTYLTPSESLPAVAIEASASESASVLGFYQSRFGVEDHREPLATAFAVPFQSDSPSVTSELMVWKSVSDFNTDDTVMDSRGYLYYAWDQDEHTVSRGVQCGTSPCQESTVNPSMFPFLTQMVPVTSNNFDLPSEYGWMLVVFPPSYGPTFTDMTPGPSESFPKYMAYAALRTYYGGYSTLTPATAMANAQCNPAEVLNALGRTGQ